MFTKRKITIVNHKNPMPKISENKTIMNMAQEFIKEKKINENAQDEINYIQLTKKTILLLELVGMKGKARIEVCENIRAKSSKKQKINFLTIDEPIQKASKTQD